MNLAEEVTDISLNLGINQEIFGRFLRKLDALKLHSYPMWEHSLRVGIYASAVALEFGHDAKLCLMGGCGHDIGKCAVPHEIIYAPKWGKAEREAMKVHPIIGFDTLEKDFLFSAFVAGMHHQFQDYSYGIGDRFLDWMNETTRNKIVTCTRLVSVCDYWDALTSRTSISVDSAYDVMVGLADPDLVKVLVDLHGGGFNETPER